MKTLLLALLILGVIGTAQALTIPASEDTMGLPGNRLTATSNAASTLVVDGAHKSYLYFNLEDIPQTAVLRWAKLRLFLPSVRTRGSGLGVHLVTSQWDEAFASAQPAVNPIRIATIGPEKLGTRRFVTVDVTSTVQAWISGKTTNEGFAVAPVTDGAAGVASISLTSKEGPFLGLPAELDLDFKPDFAELPEAIQQYFTPTFTSQPSILSSEGVLIAEVEGLGPFKYQWYKDGVAVAGGTFASLSLTGLSAGSYVLQVSNAFTSVASSGVQLTPSNMVSPAAFVLIPAGTYERGNVIGDADIGDAPVQSVTLSEYYIAKNVVTKEEWDSVRRWGIGNGYADLAEGAGAAPDHPVQSVSWYDVVKWANAASEKHGLAPSYKIFGAVYRTGTFKEVSCDWTSSGYRLPTEAEWEVAARGGLPGKRFPWGDTISQNQANFYSSKYYAPTPYSYDLSENTYGYHPKYVSAGTSTYTSPVGSFPANNYGLNDMAGNVWQWCWDRYGVMLAGTNPRGSATGENRVVRGGSWADPAGYCRIFCRLGDASPGNFNTLFGFRLARSSGR